MSIRRMMLFTLGAKIKNLVQAFKERVLATQGEFEAEACLDVQLTELDNDNLLDNASLIVTPNGYKETILYSVVPNTTIGDMSVTRATTATRVNADGLIEQVPYNLFQRSEEFENAIWLKSISTISSNVTNAPNGTLTADKLVENIGVGGSYFMQQSAQGNINTVSIYAKADSRSKLNIFYTAHNSNATFDLIAGTVFSTSGTIIAYIESVGNGWYRCVASTTLTTHVSIRFYLANDAGSVVYNGNGTSGLFIWGAQLVTGAQPKDYFPTTNRFNIPRIDYSNGSCPSILVEPQRTNLVFPSQTLTTQTRTVTAAVHTLSFYGTGSVTLSGVAIGVLNGTGANNRVTLTFTPTAGSLILTVTGSVMMAQLEAGTNATSYIPTTTAAVTRNADVIDNTNASTLIGQTEGAMFVDVNYQTKATGTEQFFSTISNGTISNSILIAVLSNENFGMNLRTSNTIQVQFIIPAASFTFGRKKILLSYKSGETNLYVNGVKIGSTNTNAFTFPVTINKFNLGSSWSGGSLANNTINSTVLYKTALTDAQAIQLTTL